MGYAETLDSMVSFGTSFHDARALLAKQLEPLGLTKEQIDSQSLPELEASLERCNKAILNPDQFGTVNISESEGRYVISTQGTTDSVLKVGILPILLERKMQILDRILQLKIERDLEGLQVEAAQIPDDKSRDKLLAQISALEATLRALQEASAEVEKRKQQEKEKDRLAEAELQRRAVELLERRSRVWLKFLQRESASTIIGALLLLLITLALLIAMFTGTEPSEVVASAFLLILGYFFGQSVGRAEEQAASSSTGKEARSLE